MFLIFAEVLNSQWPWSAARIQPRGTSTLDDALWSSEFCKTCWISDAKWIATWQDVIILESYGLLHPSLSAWWRYQGYCFITCSMHMIRLFCMKSRVSLALLKLWRFPPEAFFIVHWNILIWRRSLSTKCFVQRVTFQQKCFPSCPQFLGAGSAPHRFRPLRKDQEPTLQTGGLGWGWISCRSTIRSKRFNKNGGNPFAWTPGFHSKIHGAKAGSDFFLLHGFGQQTNGSCPKAAHWITPKAVNGFNHPNSKTQLSARLRKVHHLECLSKTRRQPLSRTSWEGHPTLWINGQACSKLWTPFLCPHTSAQLSIAMGPLMYKSSNVLMCTRCDSIIASSSWLQTKMLLLLGQNATMVLNVVSGCVSLHWPGRSHESILILQSLDITLMLRKDSGMSEMQILSYSAGSSETPQTVATKKFR